MEVEEMMRLIYGLTIRDVSVLTSFRNEAGPDEFRNGRNQTVSGEHGRPKSSGRHPALVGHLDGPRRQQINNHTRDSPILLIQLPDQALQVERHGGLHAHLDGEKINGRAVLHSVGEGEAENAGGGIHGGRNLTVDEFRGDKDGHESTGEEAGAELEQGSDMAQCRIWNQKDNRPLHELHSSLETCTWIYKQELMIK